MNASAMQSEQLFISAFPSKFDLVNNSEKQEKVKPLLTRLMTQQTSIFYKLQW